MAACGSTAQVSLGICVGWQRMGGWHRCWTQHLGAKRSEVERSAILLPLYFSGISAQARLQGGQQVREFGFGWNFRDRSKWHVKFEFRSEGIRVPNWHWNFFIELWSISCNPTQGWCGGSGTAAARWWRCGGRAGGGQEETMREIIELGNSQKSTNSIRPACRLGYLIFRKLP